MTSIALLRVGPIDFSYSHKIGRNPDQLVLQIPSLEVQAGTVYSLMGPNMSGKTTLIRILSGHLQVESSPVCLRETPVNPREPWNFRRLGVATCNQNDPLFPELSIWENILLGKPLGVARDQSSERLGRRLLQEKVLAKGDDPKLTAEAPLAHLSGGFRTVVRLLRAVVWEFDLALLDEPTVGLDGRMRALFFEILAARLTPERAAVFVSHVQEEHGMLLQMASQNDLNYIPWRIESGSLKQMELASTISEEAPDGF